MRISHISVSGLFGIFDHQIPLNLEERITIILGPNGYGKTVILRMIDGIFSSQYYKFRNIPFREFRIDFYDNQGSLILEELTNSQSRSKDLSSEGRELQLRFTRKGQRAKTHKISPKKPSDHLRYPLSMIEDDVPGLERTGSRTWRYYLTVETLTLEDIVERFPEQVHPSFFNRLVSRR